MFSSQIHTSLLLNNSHINTLINISTANPRMCTCNITIANKCNYEIRTLTIMLASPKFCWPHQIFILLDNNSPCTVNNVCHHLLFFLHVSFIIMSVVARTSILHIVKDVVDEMKLSIHPSRHPSMDGII